VLILIKIAVTGGLSSGKTSVCRILANLGAYVVSADEIVHKLLSPNTVIADQVVSLIGSDIIINGQLDRKKIAEKIFSHPEKLQALEKILHPAVQDEVEHLYEQIKDSKQYQLFVAEIPLLYESESEKFYDAVVAVLADPASCKERFTQSTQYPQEEYDRRMQRQLPPEQKAARADYVIPNNGSLEELKDNVIKLTQELHFR
jgi:dephospho-CoA kinase